jgi:SAM-dependent methyltransferase
MSAQIWDADGYAKTARFVTDLGAPVLELLAPKAGERILDVGCGDGVLTRKIADLGCAVVGLDSSANFCAAARGLGLTIVHADAADMPFEREFDAVFSNAALHWMKDADAVIGRVARALRPGGRFVAECGGHGCVAAIVNALTLELARRGVDGSAVNPWYFPTDEDYGRRLTAGGFEVRSIQLILRPTPLPDMLGWLRTFAGCFTSVLPADEREEYLLAACERMRATLCDADGNWTADYVRLRFDARLRS